MICEHHPRPLSESDMIDLCPIPDWCPLPDVEIKPQQRKENLSPKKDPQDFIGEFVSIEISPYGFRTPYDALVYRMRQRIKKELPYRIALLYSFNDMKTTVENDRIIVSGIVRVCEADCG